MANSAPAEFTEYVAVVQDLLSSTEIHVIQRRLNNQTLADIGLELDLTRERIRQIESKSIRKLLKHRDHFASYLKSIEDFLDEQGEILSIQKASDNLRDRALISDSVFRDVACILVFAQWMNVETRYKTYGDIITTEVGYDQFTSREEERRQATNHIARVMKRTCGIISAQHPSIASIAVLDVLVALSKEEGNGLRLFYAEGTNWLTTSKGRCHIATQAAKVFCISQQCDLALLSDQLHRSLRARRYEGRDQISPEVIAEWIRSSGRFRFEDGLVSCIDEGSLSDDEYIVVKTLGERDSWLYAELRDYLEGSLTKESLNRILQYSPLVICDKTNGRTNHTYKLLPISTDSAVVDADPCLTRSAVDPSHEAPEETRPQNEVPLPKSIKDTPAQRVTTTTEYSRSPIVAEYILRSSGGICECCQNRAPFLRENGEPYLEIHHVKMLSEGGSDTINNAIAVCPNCHRELHHGMSKKQLQSVLYARVSRLVRE